MDGWRVRGFNLDDTPELARDPLRWPAQRDRSIAGS